MVMRGEIFCIKVGTRHAVSVICKKSLFAPENFAETAVFGKKNFVERFFSVNFDLYAIFI